MINSESLVCACPTCQNSYICKYKDHIKEMIEQINSTGVRENYDEQIKSMLDIKIQCKFWRPL